MDKTFEKFLRSGIDLGPLGVGRAGENEPYFCTPKGASIFGWAGVDGIHFCFIRGFGGMVFSVSPMNSPEFVRPLAKDFADFLRLLVACGDSAALEQAWMWDKPQFETFLSENPPSEEQKEVLAEISSKFSLTPMENPWEYIKALQSSFDYGRIKYDSEDLIPASEEVPQEWKVYFEGSFSAHSGRERPGREIVLGKEVVWAGRRWVIPAAYSCAKGIVLDLCMRVEAEEIRAFAVKWNLSASGEAYTDYSKEQEMLMELENPLVFEFSPRLEVNGKILSPSRGSDVCYNPCFEEGEKTAGEQEAEHYGLCKDCGWVISRRSFSWKGRRPAEIKKLSLTMKRQPYRVPGGHFTAHCAGESFSLANPLSGEKYVLTVRKLENRTLPEAKYNGGNWTYPTHGVAMTYTLSPDGGDEIIILDCGPGDSPREIGGSSNSSAAISLIVGAEDELSESDPKLHSVISSLHFGEVHGDIEWAAYFIIRPKDEERFEIL